MYLITELNDMLGGWGGAAATHKKGRAIIIKIGIKINFKHGNTV